MEKKVESSCEECNKLQAMCIERLANAETILELLQPDSNPDLSLIHI